MAQDVVIGQHYRFSLNDYDHVDVVVDSKNSDGSFACTCVKDSTDEGCLYPEGHKLDLEPDDLNHIGS